MDRKEAIEILKEPLKGNLIDGKTEEECRFIEAYRMALQSLEVDEAYKLEYEKAEEVECVNLEEAIEAIKHAPVNFTIESDIDFSKYKKEIQLIICNIISAQEVAIRKLDKITVKVGEDA